MIWIFVLFLQFHCAQSFVSCSWKPEPGCKGPYTMRPASGQIGIASPFCHAFQQSAMMSCMQQCQADVCCRAFGLDAAGKCVTSNTTTETLHFVKESPDPVNLSCFQDFCSQCANGGYCILQNNAPMCMCRAGFDGTYCQTDIGHVELNELSVTITNGLDVGDWGAWDTCPTGSYAAGIQLQIQPNNGYGLQNTGANAIYVYCKSANTLAETGNVSSATMTHGDLQGKLLCQEDYWIANFKLLAEPDQGFWKDDTGANGIRVTCRGPGILGTDRHTLEQSEMFSGNIWSGWAGSCPSGTAVCSLQTRVLPD